MPAVVTFDGPNKLIIEIDVAGDNELDLVEIYSEWKEWVKTSDNAKFLQAFSVVGGDPITGTQNLGSTFFLENGWRIRPAESDHKLTIVGNLYTREPGQSVFVPTIGAFTVNTETRVSSLVDSSVSRLDLTQLLQGVYIDTVEGVSGTAEGVGVPTNPVNNIADAITIATRDKLRKFFIIEGTIVLPQSLQGYTFIGESADFQATVDCNGQNVHGSKFENITLTGTLTGSVEANGCSLNVFSDLAGFFDNCEFVNNFSIQSANSCVFANCFSGVAGASTPVCVFGTNSTASFRNYSGGLELGSMTAG